MANVQIDNGDFTRIANIILEQISKARLNGTQYSILITIWRYTYGFQRLSHEFSLSYLAEAIGIKHKEQVKRELDELINRKIVTVEKEATFNGSRVLKFNKNYEEWECTKKFTVNEKVQSTVNKKVHPPVNKLVHQERKSFKKNLKENNKYIRRQKFADDSIQIILSNHLRQKILSNNPKARLPDIQSWATHIDKMLRIDKRGPDEIREIIDFSQSDKFWMSNILSTKKLREKFDTLVLQARNKSPVKTQSKNIPRAFQSIQNAIERGNQL